VAAHLSDDEAVAKMGHPGFGGPGRFTDVGMVAE
jgi:hypothetical protein